MNNNPHYSWQEIYSHARNAKMMNIPEAKEFLANAVYYGPFNGPYTTLYEKNDRWYQVICPCLACLGKTRYDFTEKIVEVVEVTLDTVEG